MAYEIAFATAEEEIYLLDILLDSNMEIAGDIKDHVVIRKCGEVVGGGMLTATAPDEFHLIVFAVREDERGTGVGRQLIEEMIRKPWLYCHDCEGAVLEKYRVTTVAKGESAKFYEKIGFVPCGFSALADPYSDQCTGCPDICDCNPVAMVYNA